MRIRSGIITITAIFIGIGGSAMAQNRGPRKLPADAYLKSAKIDILSGELERYEGAIAMLDSLFMYYGPNAEGYHLMSQMMVDYIDKTPNLDKKKDYVGKLVLYDDSLQTTCNDKKIKKKYKKNCDEFVQLADSIQVKYWREYYNAGIQSLKRIDELIQEKSETQDSAFTAKVEKELSASVDTASMIYGLAIVIDSTNPMPYMGVATAYEKVKKYPDAISWLERALPLAPDSAKSMVQIQLAYDYINNDDYCGAIPSLRAYVDQDTSDYANMSNLAICYNNCKMYDSGFVMNRRVANSSAPDSEKVDAYGSIGRYFNQQARYASDSATADQTSGNDAGVKKWQQERDRCFDSSIVYFKHVIDVKPDNEVALEQYSTICALRAKYIPALEGFKKLVQINPKETDYWRYLGDLNVNQKKFKDAITAYEKVVELKPDDGPVWQQLADLYTEEGMPAKAKTAQKKADSLK